jgi:hypothetical protein
MDFSKTTLHKPESKFDVKILHRPPFSSIANISKGERTSNAYANM